MRFFARALVVGESFLSRSAMQTLHVTGSASTHLMRSRLARMGQLVAVHVSGHVSTSSTFSTSPGQPSSALASRCSARCRPDVAELRVRTRGCRARKRVKGG